MIMTMTLKSLRIPDTYLHDFKSGLNSGQRLFLLGSFSVVLMEDALFLDTYGPCKACWDVSAETCYIRAKGRSQVLCSSLAHEYVHFIQHGTNKGMPPYSIRDRDAYLYYLRDHEFYALLMQDMLRLESLKGSELFSYEGSFRYYVGEKTKADIYPDLKRLYNQKALCYLSYVRKYEPSSFILTLRLHNLGKWKLAVKHLYKHWRLLCQMQK